ncbi:UDP-4-amino-4,6-dideoxy-N-acetyl-beta-L-altrosamine transaminase [Flexivirga endophytica]|uniref:UDP-4-amino-4, 6-dideoxy-N-acetyl-beta-L-altrosamine transaminase n=1 Tax=Flexivirga endophytica TaxID=1849103 RepID=A0A916TC17_9MICO|nr:aminotransferase class V-fold PLP-dependent enzyme [Flexivirga endophytica]GGB38825.1 UDP-4-amino-4,6-dideoxy-N-acetyl-beta-L-altrosamine transaminase [Flexivirga endophytica]GHB46809.1 UDP-4-amino-4,6-dideoxy-N-acetyl-beta-L-altrosamine transaminase [Flexivirga endophytica]
MLPYGRQSIDESDIEAVAEVLRGDWLTTGPAVQAFECEIGLLAGTSEPAVSVTSGTAALHTAYAGLGVGPGDEVITTPLTFFATATTAMWQGARIVFADISEDTGNLDPLAVKDAMTTRTAVVAGVDFAGHPIDATALSEVAHAGGALLLEDAAHSIAGVLDGEPVGSLADVTTFSFFPTKNLTTAEGGALVSSHVEILDRARDFKGIGYTRDPARLRSEADGPWYYEVQSLGLNYRLPDVLAALGSNQLKRIEGFKARRREIHHRYNEGLAGIDALRLPVTRAGADPMWHLYPLRIVDGRRRRLFDHLRSNGIGVQVNYLPVHVQPIFAELGWRQGQFPVAETYSEQEISLPMFPGLTDADVDRVVELVRDFVGT